MRHLIGISVLLALALALKFWVHSGVGFGIYVHDALRVVPLNVIGFWLLMGIASVWFMVAAYAFIRSPA
jgi:hypothetical protein